MNKCVYRKHNYIITPTPDDPSETCATKQELDDAIANVQSQIDDLSEKVTKTEDKLSKSKQEAVEFYYNM